MSLLELAHATKRFTSGQRETVALHDVSFDVDAGECVAVCGPRRSGRTTLLRVVAGILPLDAGTVRFDGREPSGRPARGLGVEIGYCSPAFDVAHGGSVTDHVAVALLARGVGRTRARERAEHVLARVGASTSANLDPRELHVDELVRAGIARALVTRPRLLLLDEPTHGIDVLERDGIVELLRAVADGGTGVLMTTGEPVAGPDRVLTLEAGRLGAYVAEEQAPVVPLRPSQHVGPIA
jgi:ABC-type multidrug transport system ATPase subunit